MAEKDGVPVPPAGALTYSKYLRVPDLITLQNPLSKPVAHDEMLFIIVHQTYELWFKQIIHELDALIEVLDHGDLMTAFRLLDRITEIFRVLIKQIDVLETMTPVDFNRFRSNLNPASGFQSLQFREFELLAGMSFADYEKFAPLAPEWMEKLEARKQRQSLRQIFLTILKRNGLLDSDESTAVVSAISEIYGSDRNLALRNLCEYLIRFDEQVSLWRFRHVQMVERMIGMKRGTGGSLGVAYLTRTLKKRFFPELWEARTTMGGEYGSHDYSPSVK